MTEPDTERLMINDISMTKDGRIGTATVINVGAPTSGSIDGVGGTDN